MIDREGTLMEKSIGRPASDCTLNGKTLYFNSEIDSK